MTVAADLLDLLAVERQKLLNGDIDGALRLVPLKEELAGRLEATSDLRLVAAHMRRNGRLLKAAADGISSALRQIADARGGGIASRTYAPDGRRTTMGGIGRVSRKL